MGAIKQFVYLDVKYFLVIDQKILDGFRIYIPGFTLLFLKKQSQFSKKKVIYTEGKKTRFVGGNTASLWIISTIEKDS